MLMQIVGTLESAERRATKATSAPLGAGMPLTDGT